MYGLLYKEMMRQRPFCLLYMERADDTHPDIVIVSKECVHLLIQGFLYVQKKLSRSFYHKQLSLDSISIPDKKQRGRRMYGKRAF